jgi:hypothetical protein
MEVIMKKLLVLTLIASLLISLTACGEGAAVTGSGDAIGDGETDEPGILGSEGNESEGGLDFWDPWHMPREAPDFANLTVFPDRNSGEALEIPDMWITELGAYFVETITLGVEYRPDGSVIYGDDVRNVTRLSIFDSATGNQMVLCNRLTCPHDSEDCMAYLPPEPFDPMDGGGWGMRPMVSVSRSWGGWGGGTSVLFIDGQHIYALNGGRTFYRFNLDGTGRTEHLRLPDEYDASWGRNWLMNGKLYMLVSKMVPMNDTWGSYTSVSAMLEVDYIGRTTNIIWEGEMNSWVQVLGLWDGMLYFMQTVYPDSDSIDWDCPEDTRRYYDEQQITISCYNPATAQTTTVFSGTSYAYTLNAWEINEKGEIFYHSRRDEVLGRLNVRTGEKTILAENLGGDVWMGEERDGRLFLSREIRPEDPSAPWLYWTSDLFFLELATGELVELTIRTRRNVGKNPPAHILWEEEGYFYITVEQHYKEETGNWGFGNETWYVETDVLLGRIRVADYWASNESAVEELEWFDQDEWWEFYSEKMGWNRGGFVDGGVMVEYEIARG